MNFSIIHASKGRPEQAFEAIKQIVSAASGLHTFEYILVYDETDPAAARYRDLDYAHLVKLTDKDATSTRRGNLGASKSTGDVILCSADYAVYPKDWDAQVFAVTEAITDTPFVLGISDGDLRNHYWNVLPACSRKYFELDGYILYPGYHHYYADVEFYDVAVLRNMVIPAAGIKLKMNHYTTTKGLCRDSIHEESEAHMNQDRTLYTYRKSTSFGLGGIK